MRAISLSNARRFVLRKQGLLGAHAFCGLRGIEGFVRQAGCVQYDPIDVCGKSPELTLHSRVKGFSLPLLTRALYDKRTLIEYWDKNMAIVSREDWPLFARTRAASAAPTLRSFAQVEQAAPAVRAHLLQNGASFSHELPLSGRADWYWSATTVARATLEALYFRGELCVHHRQGTQKAYDLAARLLPESLLSAPDPYADADSYHAAFVKRRIGATGLLWNKPSDALLGIHGLTAAARARAFAALEARGEIAPVQVAGIGAPLYLQSADLPVLEATRAARFAPRTEVIAPLDSFLWDRRLVEALFGLRYRWEIYTPAAQREYGYYVLPLLQGEHMIGRVEPVRDAKSGCLRVRNLWLEA